MIRIYGLYSRQSKPFIISTLQLIFYFVEPFLVKVKQEIGDLNSHRKTLILLRKYSQDRANRRLSYPIRAYSRVLSA